jgi:hypothetical protein
VLAGVEEAEKNWPDALVAITSAEKEMAADPGRNGPGLYNTILGKATNIAIHAGSLDIAREFLAKAERQPKGNDPEISDARSSFLHAEISAAAHDGQAAQFMSESWAHLKLAKASCANLVRFFDEFSEAHSADVTGVMRPQNSELACLQPK